MTNAAHVEPREAHTGAPLGPGSLTWKYFGDRRSKLFFGRSGTLQNMHPAVGAALQQHSNFFDDPWDRLLRSIPRIEDSIYDSPESGAAQRVRDYHRDIKGIDHHGKRYHALNPDVYWWTHAVFVETMIALNEHFGTPLTWAEKDQLIAEGVTWWQRYGLSEQPVITNYADFQAYWNRMLAAELEANATTDFALNAARLEIPPVPGIPRPVWTVIRKPFMQFNVWLIAALMPERGREILGLRWNSLDALGFQVFSTLVRTTWPLVPRRLRYEKSVYERIVAAEKD
ncbi:DUF2236 domain-containing protein [Nocardia sp. 2]|uniref:DUF2236 domain-containing protein n=1 Tax=Nocardia acididurans TaxID=2802282 RepID=A0ABS1MDP1_9NOCA|nr:oxygenase MpaB family protein [Nocardia acididurans]MBL1078190.1 DUF2236 domain-containing protein [Nocardia acididurans]